MALELVILPGITLVSSMITIRPSAEWGYHSSRLSVITTWITTKAVTKHQTALSRIFTGLPIIPLIVERLIMWCWTMLGILARTGFTMDSFHSISLTGLKTILNMSLRTTY